MKLAISTLLLPLLAYSAFGNAVAVPKACGGRIYVESTFEIDAQTNGGCLWEFETQQDRILAISLIGGDIEKAQEFLAVYDGLEMNAPLLLVANQTKHEATRKDLPQTLYTSKPVASIRFKSVPTSNFRLKIQKAVNCPADLGVDTTCGRVVDDVSCYCATLTKRIQIEHKVFCLENAMRLLEIGDQAEENAIASLWGFGSSERFYIGLDDIDIEGLFRWDTTSTNLYPGYSNWMPGQPNWATNEDCVTINNPSGYNIGWNDVVCTTLYGAVCEAQP